MNLFFVSTPFQLINALEAIDHYKCDNNLLILREQENSAAEKQITNLLKDHPWFHIIKLKVRPTKSIYPRLVRILNEIKAVNSTMTFDYVFYTEYPIRRIATILGNVTIIKKEVMYDDGTWTLNAYNEYLRDNKTKSYSQFKRNILLYLFGYKKPQTFSTHKKFELFTFFDLSSNTFKISKNNFTRLRQKINNTKSNDSCSINKAIFIGDGGTDIGLSLTEYKKQLAKLAQQEGYLLYFPHRNERCHVKELLKDVPNLYYAKETTGPIELEVCKYNNVKAIYGYYSTALFTLAKVYPEIKIYTRKLSDQELEDSSYLKKIIKLVDDHLHSPNVYPWIDKS